MTTIVNSVPASITLTQLKEMVAALKNLPDERYTPASGSVMEALTNELEQEQRVRAWLPVALRPLQKRLVL